MKIKITIDDQLLQEAKDEAVRTNRALEELFTEGLLRVLGRFEKPIPQAPFRLVTCSRFV
jgi:hypothetical protein